MTLSQSFYNLPFDTTLNKDKMDRTRKGVSRFSALVTYMIWILLHGKRLARACLAIGQHGGIVPFQETLK